MSIRISRETDIPDINMLDRYRQAPESGPRILFFSGGTALRRTSSELVRYTHNTIHLITPFDSGGSSAVLREAFSMPAVGDIRNRLMALADQSFSGTPAIFELFAHRLDKRLEQAELRDELSAMAAGMHPLIRHIPDPMRGIIRSHLQQFMEVMPEGFNLRGASIGNLVLTAGYLTNRRRMETIILTFSKLVHACAVVRPTINQDLHLAVRLKDGSIVVGQHRITGKETTPLASSIEAIWLTRSLDDVRPAHPSISGKVKELISQADLICYPPGSFFSSVVANLLPAGVGAAVAGNPCPKVFIPNTSVDMESRGLSVAGQAALLLRHLVASGAPGGSDVLRYVLIDSEKGEYPAGIDMAGLRNLGLEVIDCRLISEKSVPYIDEHRLSEVLLSLI